MESENHFERHFDYGSFLPLLIFILGIYVCFLFVIDKNSQAVLTLMFAFIIYVINNLIVNSWQNTTIFNEYLEDMAVFITFALSPVIFGLKFYDGNMFILVIVFFYSVCQVLNLARNSVLSAKNSKGWPAPLNGLFFPLTYYVYLFYLMGPGDSIFILYFIIIGIMSVSSHNFLGYTTQNDDNALISRDKRDFISSNDKIELKNSKLDIIEKERIDNEERLRLEKKATFELEMKAKEEKELSDREKRENSTLEEKKRLEAEKKVIESIAKKKELEFKDKKKKWFKFSFFGKRDVSSEINEIKDEVKKSTSF